MVENETKKTDPEQEKAAQEQPVKETEAMAPKTEEPSKKDKKAAKKEAKEAKNAAAEELKKVKEEFETHKQQYLRVLAEYDNYRKRTEREKDAIYGTATADAVKEILPVIDNLERALAQENCSLEQLQDGLKMVNRQFSDMLAKLGVKEMGSVGEQFDPTRHNAVSHIESEDFGENEISAVYQKGYMLGDKVVRHAMVQVAN